MVVSIMIRSVILNLPQEKLEEVQPIVIQLSIILLLLQKWVKMILRLIEQKQFHNRITNRVIIIHFSTPNMKQSKIKIINIQCQTNKKDKGNQEATIHPSQVMGSKNKIAVLKRIKNSNVPANLKVGLSGGILCLSQQSQQ